MQEISVAEERLKNEARRLILPFAQKVVREYDEFGGDFRKASRSYKSALDWSEFIDLYLRRFSGFADSHLHADEKRKAVDTTGRSLEEEINRRIGAKRLNALFLTADGVNYYLRFRSYDNALEMVPKDKRWNPNRSWYSIYDLTEADKVRVSYADQRGEHCETRFPIRIR